MRDRTWKTWAASLSILAMSPVALAAESPAHLVASKDALWLVTHRQDVYGIAVRAAEQSWRKLPVEAHGRIAAVAAVADGVVVFFSNGGSVRYFRDLADRQRGVKPPRSLWPRGTKLLSARPAGGKGFGVLLLVRRPGRRRPASRPVASRPATRAAPATQTAPAVAALLSGPRLAEVALLRYTGQQWQEVSIAPPRLAGTPGRGYLAAHEGKVYVLLDQPARRLLIYEDGRWEAVAVPAGAAGGRALALTALQDKLVMCVYNLAGPGQVSLVARAAGQWAQPQVLRAGEKPQSWLEGRLPAIAAGGERLGLAWLADGKWLFAEYDLHGGRAGEGVDIFAGAGALAAAEKVKDVFLWGVLLLLVLLMFWPRQAIRTPRFLLPETMQAARLGRRGIAFAIDLVPFAAMAYYLAAGRDPEALSRAVLEGPVQPHQLYAMLSLLTAYPLYCIVLEHLYGATFGKMVMHLRVIGNTGQRATLREVALRNISKVPELMTLMIPKILILFPLLFPLVTRYRQRMGDMIARTAVIDLDRSRPAPPAPAGGTGESEGP